MITEELKEKVRQMARRNVIKALKDAEFPREFIEKMEKELLK